MLALATFAGGQGDQLIDVLNASSAASGIVDPKRCGKRLRTDQPGPPQLPNVRLLYSPTEADVHGDDSFLLLRLVARRLLECVNDYDNRSQYLLYCIRPLGACQAEISAILRLLTDHWGIMRMNRTSLICLRLWL